MGTGVTSDSYTGEYPTGTYWEVGETRELEDKYLDDLPAGLSVVPEDEGEEEAEGELTAEAWDAVAEAAEVGGNELGAAIAAASAATIRLMDGADADSEGEITAVEDAAGTLTSLAEQMETQAAQLRAAAAVLEAAADKARSKL